MGTFTARTRSREGVALIAGGIGITPIRALAEEMPGNIVLIYRALSDDDLIFRAELDALAAERSLRVEYVVGDHRAPGGD
jgi:ferredoxin-NADP reductase